MTDQFRYLIRKMLQYKYVDEPSLFYMILYQIFLQAAVKCGLQLRMKILGIMTGALILSGNTFCGMLMVQ